MNDAAITRRGLLLAAGGGLLMAGQSAQAHEALKIPQGAAPLPPEWAEAEVIRLWDGAWADKPPGGPCQPAPRAPDLAPSFLTGIAEPALHVFRPVRGNARALLVIPGGAYSFVSILNEGVDIARVFTALGYTVFVLAYRLPGEGWQHRADVPLQDAQRAIRLIRTRATIHAIDPHEIAVLGFSAGGHLAATLLTAHDEPVYPPRDAADRLDARPAQAGLIYPVIAMVPPSTHVLSAANLLGANPSAELIRRRSPAEHVTTQTPPAFLVHALDDPVVPYRNTMLFADAMRAADRPLEVHLFEEGGHGFGTGPANAPAGQWPALFAAWLARK